jgi:hypothetical protein
VPVSCSAAAAFPLLHAFTGSFASKALRSHLAAKAPPRTPAAALLAPDAPLPSARPPPRSAWRTRGLPPPPPPAVPSSSSRVAFRFFDERTEARLLPNQSGGQMLGMRGGGSAQVYNADSLASVGANPPLRLPSTSWTISAERVARFAEATELADQVLSVRFPHESPNLPKPSPFRTCRPDMRVRESEIARLARSRTAVLYRLLDAVGMRTHSVSRSLRPPPALPCGQTGDVGTRIRAIEPSTGSGPIANRNHTQHPCISAGVVFNHAQHP